VNVTAQNVLVISDDAAASAAILDALRQAPDGQPTMFWASSLVAGVARLLEGGIDAILLDLFLPDSKGIDSFDEIFVEARRIPILVFTDREHEEVARKAVQHGAKDRVLKSHIGQSAFVLVLQHIMARAAVEDALFVERERAQITLNPLVTLS
jgi:DNA-binding NarL/FixJ family response regulator